LGASYRVKTDDGSIYNCYVQGFGIVMSDALCSQMATTGDKSEGKKKPPSVKPKNKKTNPGAQCNELLRAAGRC
jgi:hypothetical protein